jgi:hypothetical protein
MAHYQYFITPKTPLTNEKLNQIPGVQLYDEFKNLYYLPDLEVIKTILKIKQTTQGTGGRNSEQPIDFSLHRRLGDEGEMAELNRSQTENLLRGQLKLKPKYLRMVKH